MYYTRGQRLKEHTLDLSPHPAASYPPARFRTPRQSEIAWTFFWQEDSTIHPRAKWDFLNVLLAQTCHAMIRISPISSQSIPKRADIENAATCLVISGPEGRAESYILNPLDSVTVCVILRIYLYSLPFTSMLPKERFRKPRTFMASLQNVWQWVNPHMFDEMLKLYVSTC